MDNIIIIKNLIGRNWVTCKSKKDSDLNLDLSNFKSIIIQLYHCLIHG